MDERIIQLRDGHPMFFRVWHSSETLATMHINHGMTEHSERYDEFAEYLAGLGITVYAQDHRGHGFTKAEDEKGWFADRDGWALIAEDSWELDKLISQEFPHVPHFPDHRSLPENHNTRRFPRSPQTGMPPSL